MRRSKSPSFPRKRESRVRAALYPWTRAFAGVTKEEGVTRSTFRHACKSGHPGERHGGRISAPMKQPCVYILASKRNGTLYVGVTADAARRVAEHRTDAVDGFTKRYGVHRLVYAEFHETMLGAIEREKALKKWRR